MHQTMRVLTPAATAHLLPSGVLVVAWRGVVTMRAADAAKAEIAARLPWRPAAIVSDYRGAALALDADELLRIMLGGPHEMPELPAAVVAHEAVSHAMRRASMSAAWAGRWRCVFHGPSPALAWAHHQAQVAPPQACPRRL